MNKRFWQAVGIRVIRTMAQTAAALIGTTALLSEINWLVVASATAVAGVLCVLTSLGGLPEVED